MIRRHLEPLLHRQLREAYTTWLDEHRSMEERKAIERGDDVEPNKYVPKDEGVTP